LHSPSCKRFWVCQALLKTIDLVSLFLLSLQDFKTQEIGSARPCLELAADASSSGAPAPGEGEPEAQQPVGPETAVPPRNPSPSPSPSSSPSSSPVAKHIANPRTSPIPVPKISPRPIPSTRLSPSPRLVPQGQAQTHAQNQAQPQAKPQGEARNARDSAGECLQIAQWPWQTSLPHTWRKDAPFLTCVASVLRFWVGSWSLCIMPRQCIETTQGLLVFQRVPSWLLSVAGERLEATNSEGVRPCTATAADSESLGPVPFEPSPLAVVYPQTTGHLEHKAVSALTRSECLGPPLWSLPVWGDKALGFPCSLS